MRAAPSGAGDASCAAIKIYPGPDKMEWNVATPLVGDRKLAAIDLSCPHRLQSSEPELVEENKKPPLASHGRGRVLRSEPCECFIERGPRAHRAVPRSVDHLADAFIRVEVVVKRLEPCKAWIVVSDPREDVGRQ